MKSLKNIFNSKHLFKKNKSFYNNLKFRTSFLLNICIKNKKIKA